LAALAASVYYHASFAYVAARAALPAGFVDAATSAAAAAAAAAEGNDKKDRAKGGSQRPLRFMRRGISRLPELEEQQEAGGAGGSDGEVEEWMSLPRKRSKMMEPAGQLLEMFLRDPER